MDLLTAKLALECLLFVADGPLDKKRLCGLIGIDGELFEAALQGLHEDLADRSLQVLEVAGGYRMMTRPAFASYAEALFEPSTERVSRSALEVLAVVAYRQPVTRPEIDAIRGVNSSAALVSLLRKGLIREAGRKETPGRPILYATTDEFLKIAGLSGLEDLPHVDTPALDARVLGLPGAVAEGPGAPAATDDEGVEPDRDEETDSCAPGEEPQANAETDASAADE